MMRAANVTSGVTMALTQPKHIAGNATLVATGGPADDYGPLQYRNSIQPALDGNTVDLDTGRVQFADNTLHFESLITDVSGGVKTLQAAVTSGGS
jgi:flagellar basal-body rod protein FlgB